MGAGMSLEGAPEFDLASSNYANATVHLGPVMATSAGLIHHSELDPFPHIDPYILDLIAMESGIGEVNRTSSRDMPSGQEISYTQQTNGASEDATESGGHTETPLLAESSPAPAYRLAKPRSPAKCTLCDKSMIRSDALGRHLKKQHHMSDARAKAVVAQVAASKYLTG
ncbi:hypothetical protein IEO21_09470 [Rhodonia placenta]|uniref:C2H2-type domain-containing protein n=1 Tax=Rhodonia placenta TaxID=104341 RepID=A0A8H7TYF6_9APHY|nr:hypothetical protein IEO21_09470 [Postia placenta]